MSGAQFALLTCCRTVAC